MPKFYVFLYLNAPILRLVIPIEDRTKCLVLRFYSPEIDPPEIVKSGGYLTGKGALVNTPDFYWTYTPKAKT